VTERYLPDKAVDLIDEAAAKLRIDMFGLPEELKEEKNRLQELQTKEEDAWQRRDYEQAARFKSERLQLEREYEAAKAQWAGEERVDLTVSASDIASLVAKMTGIPVDRLMEGEADKLLNMEERIHQRIVDQKEAVAAVSDAIRRARSGLKDPRRPIGSFIFLGPTGVGKTELARTLARFLFDDENAMVRLDMSEYQERHTVSRLIGAPPGYVGYEEGGVLTEAVRRRPYQVVLFDEVEKAHRRVLDILLQVMEEGRLTDAQGNVANFGEAVIIMTSNLGTEFARRGGTLGFIQSDDPQVAADQEKIEKALRDTFRPEFINRVDETVVFHPLGKEHIRKIVDIQLGYLHDRLADRDMRIHLSDAARDKLAEAGIDPVYGARPLKRAIQRLVQDPLALRLLEGEFSPGDAVLVDDDGTTMTLTRAEQAEPVVR